MEQLSEKRKEPANQGEDAKMRKFDLDERLTPWRRNVCADPNPKTSGVAARDVSTGQFVLSVVFWVLGPQRRSASNPLGIGYSAWIFGARAAKRTRRRSELPSRLSPFAIWALGWTDRRKARSPQTRFLRLQNERLSNQTKQCLFDSDCFFPAQFVTPEGGPMTFSKNILHLKRR